MTTQPDDHPDMPAGAECVEEPIRDLDFAPEERFRGLNYGELKAFYHGEEPPDLDIPLVGAEDEPGEAEVASAGRAALLGRGLPGEDPGPRPAQVSMRGLGGGAPDEDGQAAAELLESDVLDALADLDVLETQLDAHVVGARYVINTLRRRLQGL